MPNANLDGPPIIDVDIKRTLVKEITDAMEKAYKFPREAYVITITEREPANVGIGGKLLIDMVKK